MTFKKDIICSAKIQELQTAPNRALEQFIQKVANKTIIRMATAAAAARQNTSIEFVVKPREDLYLEGKFKTLPRVQKADPYPCQMQKNQTFSCLFRHYAKHNGLKKEDLVFYFVDELLPDQMPETVHLMPQDEIWVEHRVKAATKIEKKPEVSSAVFGQQFRALFRKGCHSDVTFIVGEDRMEFTAHKAILSARSDFFEAMFRPGGMIESSKAEIEMQQCDKNAFRRMLEFIYGGDVEDLDQCSSGEIISLLEMSNEYLLLDLCKLCEHAAAKIVNTENIGKFMLLCSRYISESLLLRSACTRFVAEHGRQLRTDPNFRKEIELFPELGLLILDATAEDEDSNRSYSNSKRRRITESREDAGQGGEGSNTIGGGEPSNAAW